MKNKIISLLTNNIGLKLASVLFAMLLWLVVVNIDNPQTTVSFTGTAQIINEDTIIAEDKVYSIVDNSDIVTFSVTGPRSVVEGMSAADFTIIADMTRYDGELGLLPVEVTANRYANQVTINVKSNNVQIALEKKETTQSSVVVAVEGEVKSGYAVGDIKCSPKTVTISGPQSVIESINRVVATINVDNLYSERTADIVPVLYDAEGNIITNANISIEPAQVRVTAEILATKTINVNFQYDGGLPKGYSIDSITCLPSSILVKGLDENLEGISSVTIPTSVLDLSTTTEGLELTVDIREYLPEGISIVSDDDASVIIKVEVSSAITRTIDVSVDQIEVIGLEEGLEVEFNSPTVSVSLTGSAAVINKLVAGDLDLVLDFSEVKTGSFHLTPEAKDLSGVDNIKVSSISGLLYYDDTEDLDDNN